MSGATLVAIGALAIGLALAKPSINTSAGNVLVAAPQGDVAFQTMVDK